jgi:hypothetical protein
MEQRAAIKFRVKLKNTVTEMLEMLTSVYYEEYLSKSLAKSSLNLVCILYSRLE